MFAVGHIALGYIIGKIIGKATEQNPNLPALWTLSLMPDIDLLIPGLEHRGPTHSLLVAFLLFTPLFIIKSKKTVPYFAALASHSLIGDFITSRARGSVQLLWPVSTEWMRYEGALKMGSVLETNFELAIFGMLIATLILSKDFNHLFHSEIRNTMLFIPLSTIVLPVMFKYPLDVPEILVIPHLFLLSIIALSFSLSLLHALSTINKIKTQTF